METEFLDNFLQFSVENFNFDPSTCKISFNYHKTIINLEDLNFPRNEKLVNLFFYECLSLLLKLQNLYKEKIKKL